MFVIVRRAAAFAALICISAIPAYAQQQPAAAPQSSDSYKPPARFVAPAGETKARKSEPGQSATAGTKTIGLISIVGDSFMVKTVGVIVFGNEEHEVPISEWRVDDRVAAQATRMLSRNFTVKRIPVPAGTYAKYEKALAGTDYRERLRKLVTDFASSQKCDFYLLVAPGGSQVGDTNQGVGGLGTLRTTVFFNPVQHVFALTEIIAYDPQFKTVRWEYGSIGQDRFFVAIKGPHQKLEENQYLPLEPKAAASDPRARQIALELLDKSIAKTLPKLFAAN
jgi:hypothetical protein